MNPESEMNCKQFFARDIGAASWTDGKLKSVIVSSCFKNMLVVLRCVPMYRGTPCCCFLMVWLFSFFLQQCSRWWQFMEYCSALLCVRHYVWIKEKKNNSLLLLLKESLHYIKGSVLCMLVISSNSWFGALCCPLEMNCRKAFACCLLCSACRREFNMDIKKVIFSKANSLITTTDPGVCQLAGFTSLLWI